MIDCRCQCLYDGLCFEGEVVSQRGGGGVMFVNDCIYEKKIFS